MAVHPKMLLIFFIENCYIYLEDITKTCGSLYPHIFCVAISNRVPDYACFPYHKGENISLITLKFYKQLFKMV